MNVTPITGPELGFPTTTLQSVRRQRRGNTLCKIGWHLVASVAMGGAAFCAPAAYILHKRQLGCITIHNAFVKCVSKTATPEFFQLIQDVGHYVGSWHGFYKWMDRTPNAGNQPLNISSSLIPYRPNAISPINDAKWLRANYLRKIAREQCPISQCWDIDKLCPSQEEFCEPGIGAMVFENKAFIWMAACIAVSTLAYFTYHHCRKASEQQMDPVPQQLAAKPRSWLKSKPLSWVAQRINTAFFIAILVGAVGASLEGTAQGIYRA